MRAYNGNGDGLHMLALAVWGKDISAPITILKKRPYLDNRFDYAGQLRIYNKEGETSSYLGEGYYQAYNQFGERTLFLGTGTSGGGYLRTYNFNGQKLST